MSSNVPLKRAIVAVETDGVVVFVYGYTHNVRHDMERTEIRGLRLSASLREYDDPEYTTTVEWAYPPTQSMRYPSDADFARALPENQRQLPTGSAAMEGAGR